MITGMNRVTGQSINGIAHLRQSIGDILTTPIGSRVLLSEYGSRLPDLIDRPMNRALKIDVTQAVADALAKWEPRFVIDRVSLSRDGIGRFLIDLYGRYNSQRVTLEGVLV